MLRLIGKEPPHYFNINDENNFTIHKKKYLYIFVKKHIIKNPFVKSVIRSGIIIMLMMRLKKIIIKRQLLQLEPTLQKDVYSFLPTKC